MFEILWTSVLNRPVVISLVAVVTLWVSAYIGAYARQRWRPLKDDERETYKVILGATITLLGLVIAFSFSMAEGRYDHRKNCEQEEANAIGTEFMRAGLLPTDEAAQVRDLLRQYLDQRILFYREREDDNLGRIDSATTQLQREMWSVVRSVAQARPTPIVTLAVAGMNDVLNSEGYTQAAWWYRIPEGAWAFMATIGLVSCALIGYGSEAPRHSLLVLVPVGLSVAFFFIADIDSSRHGVIRPAPHNLVRLSQTIRSLEPLP